jgi:hypothetical protein
MLTRRSWLAVGAGLLVAFSTTPAQATPAPFLAEAGFGVVGNAKYGYAVRFTVRRDFTTSTTRIDLVSEVYRCSFSTLECDLVSEQVDALSVAALRTRTDGTATLRTDWAGKPLVIDWRHGGRNRGAATGHSYTFAGNNHTEEMVEYRATWSRATARSLLGGGRDCNTPIATTMSAVGAVAQDALVMANELPRAEKVPGLGASRGRCYRTN